MWLKGCLGQFVLNFQGRDLPSFNCSILFGKWDTGGPSRPLDFLTFSTITLLWALPVGPIFVTSSETAHWGVVMIELFCLLLQINSKRPIHTCLCASILWVWAMGLVGHGSSLEKFPPPGYCLQG